MNWLRNIDFEKWDVRLSVVEAFCFGAALGILVGAVIVWSS